MASLEVRQDHGWEVLHLSNEAVEVRILPALGGSVTSVVRRADGAELLHQAPGGLRPFGAPTVSGSAEADRWDHAAAGWETLFPNGGDSVNAHGAEWGHDGEARVTWLDWTFAGSTLVLTGRLRRAPFELTRTVSLHDHELTVEETVTNVSRERIEVMWGQQLRFGADLLGPDTVVDSGASLVRPDPRTSRGVSYEDLLPWPRSYGHEETMVNLRGVPAAAAGETRRAYLSEFGRPWARVSRPVTGLAVELTWDGVAWPFLWYELEAGGHEGFPWFSDGYFLTLTPSSSWPAHGLHDARRVSGTTVWLAPGEIRTSQLTLRLTPVRAVATAAEPGPA